MHRLLLLLLPCGGGCLFVDPGPGAYADGGVEASTAGSAAPTTGEPPATTDASTGPSATTTGGPMLDCGWQQVLTDKQPAARIDAALALAPGGAEVLLYGGRVGLVGPDLGDTWSFDGERWRQLFTSDEEEDDDDEGGGEAPGPRRGHAMAHDAARDRVLLFGGEYGGFDIKLADHTWTHDGDGWTRRNSGPSPRAYAAMADLPRAAVVVLFGGRTDKGPDGETWAWNGQDWKRLEMVMGPPPRYGHTMTLDGAGDVLLYGGCGDPLCGKPLDDTWRFDGERWERLDMGGPDGLRGGAIVHASAAAHTLRLAVGESWLWTDMAWAPAGAAPPALGRFSVSDLPGTGLALFGGMTSKVVESDETWLLRCP